MIHHCTIIVNLPQKASAVTVAPKNLTHNHVEATLIIIFNLYIPSKEAPVINLAINVVPQGPTITVPTDIPIYSMPIGKRKSGGKLRINIGGKCRPPQTELVPLIKGETL